MERWISDKITNLQDIFGTGLAPEQSKAIMKGLAVKKEDRYQDVVQLAEVLYDEHVMRQNLWFRTEELPHQMLSGGHTQTVRREAAAFLKKSDPKKKMMESGSRCCYICGSRCAVDLSWRTGKQRAEKGLASGESCRFCDNAA